MYGAFLALAVALLALAAWGPTAKTQGTTPPSAPSAQAKADAVPTPGEAPNRVGANLARDFPIVVYRGAEVMGGEELQFSRLFDKGQPVVLNYFAGLCPPCRAEMPDIQSVSARYQGQVIFFGLDIGPFVGLGSRADGKALVQKLGVTYPTGTTLDGSVVRAYQILGMPTTVFLTPDGKALKKWTGLLTRAKLSELVEELLRASGK